MKPSFKLMTLAAVGCATSSLSFAQKSDLPNVIYIMADDLGIGDLGCYGQTVIKTPAIDQLAKNGMRFTQHYSGSTVSAPSRASLMTGLHTGNTFIRGNLSQKCSDGELYDLPLPKEAVTVADIFKQANYATACIGKWGMGGPDTEGLPSKHGFDYFYGYLGQLHAHKHYPDFLWENGEKIILNKKEYSHDLVMNKALNFIENNAESPFFIYLTPTIPHAELVVPDGEIGVYENQFCEVPYEGGHYMSQAKPLATYAAMVSRLDADVARIVSLLQDKGILDNTIIIFTSDNGVHAEGGHDSKFFHSSGPFRGIKRDLYDGGIRTPFVVQWPAKIKAGSVNYHVSAFWDFLPTMSEIVGVKMATSTDGISYLPSLLGKGNQQKHDFLYWEFHEEGGKRAVLKDNWKLIQLNVNHQDKSSFELYNLSSDPAEIANVAEQFPNKVSELSTLLVNARTKNTHWNFKNN